VDQCVAMFTVLNPVTQIEDTAVNSASANGVVDRDAVAIGSDNTAVMINTSPVKTTMANRAGDEAARKSTESRR
jgi:hypothetical protein